ncbi:hypothetical protein Taro_050145, partial [Colocasia esculenta]|nr:hypothetical protein [Colocasia esculenta]
GRARHPGRDVVALERSAATTSGRATPGHRFLVATGVAVVSLCQTRGALTRPVWASRLLFRSPRFDRLFGVAPRATHAPFPLYIVFPLWFRAWECENSMLEFEHDPSGGRDLTAMDLLVAIKSRRSWASRPGRDGYGRRDSVVTGSLVRSTLVFCLYQPYQQQKQYPQQSPQQQQPQQAPQCGRGRGRVMALTREQAEASNLVIGQNVLRWVGCKTRPPWAIGPVLRVAPGDLAVPGDLAATLSRQSGLPRQRQVAPHPAAAFLSRRGLPTTVRCQMHATLMRPVWALRLLFRSPRFDRLFGVTPGVTHAPLPLWNACLVFLGRSPEEALRNPPLLKTRPFWRSRSYRDGLAGRDRIVTLLGVATWSRRLRPPRQRRDRVGRRDQVAAARCETSQQRQGTHRAEETGR